MKKLNLVATGGTFDYIHIGHLKLLSAAFNIGNHLIIGLTSDDFVKRFKPTSNIKNSYETRYQNLKEKILQNFNDVNYTIIKLEDEFGPVISSSEIQAIVVSEETLVKVQKLNDIRITKCLNPLNVIVVEIAKSEDGLPISSTRIRNGEIDDKGTILRK
ncbi:MAG TPA: pantetheine-phosphate adenylyltransferase [Nitrososphaeraceae archaeon]|nr:pantetheine-phosphate adenylyltransferase [Nitrososphaeraceae archaeon]HEU5172319.1 pantetheine-phosphate adenylyltransferase [Nitrososphaeraceae archaeon]